MIDPLGSKEKPSGCQTWLQGNQFGAMILKAWRKPLIRSSVEFSVGLILSLLWFLMMTLHMELSLSLSLTVSAILGLFFSVGLAFSGAVRCVVLLMMPSLCSSQGRALLLAYSFILVLNHPMGNFERNLEVVSDSITCSQKMGQDTRSGVVDAVMAPSRAMLESMSAVLVSVTEFSRQVQRTLLEVRDVFREVVASVGSVMRWMTGMEVRCNDKMGGPYRKCKKALDDADKDCREKIKVDLFDGLCSLVKRLDFICHVARVGELLCLIPQAVNKVAEDLIDRQLRMVFRNMTEMFYFEVAMDYTYNVTVVQSKSYVQISRDIRSAIAHKLSVFYTALQLADVVVFLLLLLLFLKAYLYRRKYLSKDSFDNRYLSPRLLILDTHRQGMGKVGIFPMSYRERKRYIKVTSLRLVSAEKQKLWLGLVFLFGTVIHGCFYLILDSGLYSILNLITSVGKLSVTEEVPSHLKLHVEGDGVLSDVYRSLFTQFDPLDKEAVSMDSTRCLPQPVTPDWDVYKEVAGLYIACLLLVVLEAYILRSRHLICGLFYPDRKRDRAVWLYSHILRQKGHIFLTAWQGDPDSTTLSRVVARFPFLGKVLKLCGYSFQTCGLCGTTRKKTDNNGLTACENSGCKAVYCSECLPETHNVCVSCTLPIDYSLTARYGEEMDSSEEETVLTRAGLQQQHTGPWGRPGGPPGPWEGPGVPAGPWMGPSQQTGGAWMGPGQQTEGAWMGPGQQREGAWMGPGQQREGAWMEQHRHRQTDTQADTQTERSGDVRHGVDRGLQNEDLSSESDSE